MTPMLHRARTWLTRAWSNAVADRGASLVEYALLLALIALVCLVGVAFLGTSTNSGFDRSGSSIAAGGAN